LGLSQYPLSLSARRAFININIERCLIESGIKLITLQWQIMGTEVVVAATNGKLHFGPWELIFYGE
jgi:hypothetical protein